MCSLQNSWWNVISIVTVLRERAFGGSDQVMKAPPPHEWIAALQKGFNKAAGTPFLALHPSWEPPLFKPCTLFHSQDVQEGSLQLADGLEPAIL